MNTRDVLARVADETGYRCGRNWFAIDPFHGWRFIPPGTAGVYAVQWAGETIYVGQSKDLRRRLYSYKIAVMYMNGRGLVVSTPWGEGVVVSGGISVRVRSTKRRGDWIMNEQRLIRRLRPRFNRQAWI